MQKNTHVENYNIVIVQSFMLLVACCYNISINVSEILQLFLCVWLPVTLNHNVIRYTVCALSNLRVMGITKV